MKWFSKVIAYHPFVVLTAVAIFSMTCVILPLTTIKLPDFKDPQMGFEARGTEIGQRLNSWENLLKEVRPSGLLTVNPTFDNSLGKRVGSKSTLLTGKLSVNKPSSTNEISAESSHSHNVSMPTLEPNAPWNYSESEKEWVFQKPGKLSVNKPAHTNEISAESSHSHNVSVPTPEPKIPRNYSESEMEWVFLKSDFGLDHDEESHPPYDHLGPDAFFCAGPSEVYARVVLSSRNDEDLFSLPAVLEMCQIETYLMSKLNLQELCESISPGKCCRQWSLVNYLIMLNNRSSCFELSEKDIIKTKKLVSQCHKYFLNLQTMANFSRKGIPLKCKKHNTVNNLLHYILDYEFKNISSTLRNSLVLLPLARSTASLDYYYSLDSQELKSKRVFVSAMDFGLKDAVFDETLIRDTRLMGLGAGFICIAMWLYTSSLFVTLMTFVAIAFSLGISYFIYTLIFEFKFFPFMNLLASVVAIGVGGDAGMVVCKVWSSSKCEDTRISLPKLVYKSHRHSAVCMLVSSLTTAAAFYSSYVSSVTAIRCFSIFAGTAVVANFLVMIPWIPATLVISEKLPSVMATAEPLLKSIATHFRSTLVFIVLKLKYVWLLILGALAGLSMVTVLYYPRFRLPDSPNFQLFHTGHPFEQYDLVYKDRFWFERLQMVDMWNKPNMKLPLRFVWGVKPVDLGNYMDPSSRGEVEFDSTFDLADPDSQEWLHSFCSNLRKQPFYQPTMGPLLPNCFLETFVEWMGRRCSDSVHPGLNRTPCCETAQFPYTRSVFSQCMVRAANSLYYTPAELSMPGVAGPKFSSIVDEQSGVPELRALVVEYDSNFSFSTSYIDMNRFYSQVEEWSRNELLKAPPGMKNGWFVSYLGLYDLQKSLQEDTIIAIGVSLAVAFLVILFSTLNPILSLMVIVNITATIFVTIASLILLGWRLNVLEAVAVSVAIGLAVDFSIHYVVNYKIAPDQRNRESAVVYSLQMMAGPTLMAATTTGVAGGFMCPSQVLAYTQIGLFLVIVMSVSWIYATLFLMSGLLLFGPQKGPDDPVRSTSTFWPWEKSKDSKRKRNEEHELQRLGKHKKRQSNPDRSPSAASATTIIHDDEVNTEIAILSVDPC